VTSGLMHTRISSTWVTPIASSLLTCTRYYARSMYEDLHYFNDTSIGPVLLDMPDCLDGIQLAYEEPTIAHRVSALNACIKMKHEELLVGRDVSDNRCTNPGGCFMPALQAVEEVMNATRTKIAVGLQATGLGAA
jgi:hypothetical protein